MKLADIKSSKLVAMCDRSALFGFMKLDSAEIPRIKPAAFRDGVMPQQNKENNNAD